MAVAHEASSAVRLEPAVCETAARLFEEHSGWIYGYCLRLLRSPEEAEDALQATYLNACRSLNDGVRPQVDSAWLLRIAQNVCLTRLRSSGRRARLERVQDVELLEETVAAPTHRGDELIGLTDALASLPEQQRRAILLREWQGLSYAEVAARLELTQSAVETLIFRARRSLAAALENPGKRRRLRFAHALDVAGLFAAVKGFFAGSASAKIAAAVVVAATTATVAATDPAGVWRDGADVATSSAAAAEEAVAGSRSSAGGPGPAATAAAVAQFNAAERAFHATPGGPASGKNDRGKSSEAPGRQAAEAKAGENGKALGHTKTKKPKPAKSQGTPGGSTPEFAGTQGPPPHAVGQGSAQSQADGTAEGSGGGGPVLPEAVETAQDKSSKSGKAAKSSK